MVAVCRRILQFSEHMRLWLVLVWSRNYSLGRPREVSNGLSKVRFNPKETGAEVRGQEELECRHLGVSQSDLFKSNYESFHHHLFCWCSLGWGPPLGGVNLGEEGWHGLRWESWRAGGLGSWRCGG